MCCEIGPVWSEWSVKTQHEFGCDHWSWTTRRCPRRGNVTYDIFLILRFRSPIVRSTTRHESIAFESYNSAYEQFSRHPVLGKFAWGPGKNFKTCHVKFIWLLRYYGFRYQIDTLTTSQDRKNSNRDVILNLVAYRHQLFSVHSAFVLRSPGFRGGRGT